MLGFHAISEQPISALAPAAAPAFGGDENGDAWWAGVQRCFVAVPMATLAATVLSASLCWSAQQQNDDVAFAQAAVDEAYGPRFVSIKTPRLISVWGSETAASAPVVVSPDEDYWQGYIPPLPIAKVLYLADLEDIPTGPLVGVPEQDPWIPPVLQSRRPWTAVWWADVDATISTPAEDESWSKWPPVLRSPSFLYLPDPETLPAGSLFGVPEQDTWTPPTVLRRPVWGTVWWSEDEVPVRTPAEDDSWSWWTPSRRPTSVVYLPDPEQIPAGVLHGQPEQDPWVAPWVIQRASTGLPLWVDDPLPITPTGATEPIAIFDATNRTVLVLIGDRRYLFDATERTYLVLSEDPRYVFEATARTFRFFW